MTISILSATLQSGNVNGTGTGDAAVECRVKHVKDGVTTWYPANGYQSANEGKDTWSVQIPVGNPGNPPGSYTLYVRYKNNPGSEQNAPVTIPLGP